MSWVVYILRCADGTLYTGVAKDLARRLAQHNAGKGAKYTRGRVPVKLFYEERCVNQGLALRREAEIRRLTRRQKQQLGANKRA